MDLNVYNGAKLHVHHSFTERPDPDECPLHVHDGYELFLFLQGEVEYFVEGRHYPMLPHNILLMQPGEAHRPIPQSCAPYERVVFEFDAAALHGIDPEKRLLAPFRHPPGQQNYYPPETIAPELIHTFLEQLERARNNEYETQLVAHTFLPLFLLELQNQPAQRHEKPAGLAARVTDYINRHLSESWTLDDLSAHVFVSKTYLNKKFKEATGATVWQYVIVKRLQLARQRILAGTPIRTVFEQSGFNDYATFFKRYRERFGLSPREDQLLHKEQPWSRETPSPLV